MAIRIKVRRGTASDWTSANPTLASGEVAFETDTRKLKIGDGSTSWTSLQYVTGTGSGGGGLENIIEDLSPQLGGDLDVNGNEIVSASGNIGITPGAGGAVIIDGMSWPTSLGLDGQVLQTDSLGNLSFVSLATNAITSPAVALDTLPNIDAGSVASVVKLSAAQYADIGTKDPNTIYFVV
jgi:hypothetical protein